MVAKLIVHAPTREHAIARMRQALKETVILGTTTNRDFLLALLDDPTFQAGTIHTAYIDQNLETLLPAPPEEPPPAVLIALALQEAQSSAMSAVSGDTDADRFSPWAVGDGFRMKTHSRTKG